MLVGNFNAALSEINAFDPTTGVFKGTIQVNPGAGDTAGGLWDLTFGGGGIAGDRDTLFFTDGIDGEKDGLFGALTVPEPSTWAMMLWVWRTRTLGCAAARVPSRRLKGERGPEPPEIGRFFSGRRVTVKP